MAGFTGDQLLAKPYGALLDCLSQGQESVILRLFVLHGTAHCSQEVFQDDLSHQRTLTHVVEFLPEAIKLAALAVIEHQTCQVVVLSVEQSGRVKFVHGDDLGITEGSRKDGAERLP